MSFKQSVFYRDLGCSLRSCLSKRCGEAEGGDIMVFATPRSGSTWIKEIIASQKNIKFINEPLLMETLTRRQFGAEPAWTATLPGPDREVVFERYFSRLLKGTCGYGSPSLRSEFFRRRYDRVVFKLLRGHDMMSWFEATFGVKIVYLIRHPVPVALSRSEYKRLPIFLGNQEFCRKYLTQSQVNQSKRILKNGSELEKKVLDWLLQNVVPLRFLDQTNWLVLTYEQLVQQPDTEFPRLIDFLKLDHPERAIERLNRASATTRKSDERTQRAFSDDCSPDADFLINKWRSQVENSELEAVQSLLDLFEIDLYRADQSMPISPLSKQRN